MIIKIFKDLIVDFDNNRFYAKIPDMTGILIIDKSAIIEYEIDYLLVDMDLTKVYLFGDEYKRRIK